MFTEFKFDPVAVKELAAAKAANLKANKGFSDLKGYALAVIARRLVADPIRYRDYGPYWWAIKDLLRDNGASMGDWDDSAVRVEYRGGEAVDTLVMADHFRIVYLSTWAVGTNQFSLNADSDDTYTLEDPDMEQLAEL